MFSTETACSLSLIHNKDTNTGTVFHFICDEHQTEMSAPEQQTGGAVGPPTLTQLHAG